MIKEEKSGIHPGYRVCSLGGSFRACAFRSGGVQAKDRNDARLEWLDTCGFVGSDLSTLGGFSVAGGRDSGYIAATVDKFNVSV